MRKQEEARNKREREEDKGLSFERLSGTSRVCKLEKNADQKHVFETGST